MDNAIEVLFVGENEHLVIEKFIGRALTIEEIGSIKPEAFPVNLAGVDYRLIKIPREWSRHPTKKLDQFFDKCTCVTFVIDLNTCNLPSTLDPAKNQISAAIDTIKHFSSLSFMAFKTFCLFFFTPDNIDALVDNSALAPYIKDPINGQVAFQNLNSYIKETINTPSIHLFATQCAPNANVQEVLARALKDIILGGALRTF